ncbi:MAG: ribonuclease P protein component [Verrucomicrobiota bacterium]
MAPSPASIPRLRFPRSVRLRRTGEFQQLKREGISFHGKFMVLSILKNRPVKETQIGLITSRRVGGAVIRNRVRRRLREMVRLDRSRLEKACWLVLIARQRAAGVALEELQREWRLLARRAGLLPAEL